MSRDYNYSHFTYGADRLKEVHEFGRSHTGSKPLS